MSFRQSIGIGAVACVIALAACSGKKDDAKPAAKKDAATVTARDAAPVAKKRDAAPRASGSEVPRIPKEFVKVGVEACDTYIEKQRTCLEEKAPEKIRKPQLLGLRSIAAKWAEAAKAGRGENLAKTCAHMLESSKKATAEAWGCAW